ncbi:MAG: hypothetical protein OXH63_03830, partial [Gemmatimonadetes bacterium]|nr:hypothetical protein [Gemmatimonadota bacterium]
VGKATATLKCRPEPYFSPSPLTLSCNTRPRRGSSEAAPTAYGEDLWSAMQITMRPSCPQRVQMLRSRMNRESRSIARISMTTSM